MCLFRNPGFVVLQRAVEPPISCCRMSGKEERDKGIEKFARVRHWPPTTIGGTRGRVWLVGATKGFRPENVSQYTTRQSWRQLVRVLCRPIQKRCYNFPFLFLLFSTSPWNVVKDNRRHSTASQEGNVTIIIATVCRLALPSSSSSSSGQIINFK